MKRVMSDPGFGSSSVEPVRNRAMPFWSMALQADCTPFCGLDFLPFPVEELEALGLTCLDGFESGFQ
ncbi:hypothetical protein D3C86_2003750 [compost metagenome]